MDTSFHIGVSLILIACAYFDWKNKMVPDILTAMLWIILFFVESPNAFAFAGCAFAIIYLINALITLFQKIPLLSWADILGMPTFTFSMVNMGAPLISISIVVCAVLVLSYLKKKEIPLFPFLASTHLIFLIFYLEIMTST